MSVASVQELIAAANASQPRSPLAELINSASQGYDQGLALKEKRLQIATQLLQQQEIQRKMEYQKNQDAMINDFLGKRENSVQDGLKATGADNAPATPDQKFEKSVTFGPEGASLGIKMKEPKAFEVKYTPEQVGAINSSDPTLMGKAFGGQIPKDAAALALSSQRATNTKNEQDASRVEKINKQVLDYSQALENHPVIKELKKQEIGLNQINDLLGIVKSGNTVAANALGTKAARAMGEVGVLTDSDVTRYVQSGQMTRAAADKFSKMINGKPTDATLGEIEQISNALKDSFGQKIQPIYDTYVNRLSRNLNLTPEDAAYKLDVPYTGTSRAENPSGKKSSTPTPLATPANSNEALKAQVRKKLGL